jgi:hypothetical protein
MNVAVGIQRLLNLAVNRVKILLLLLVRVVALVDEADAGVDAVRRSLAHVDAMVLQGVEDQLDVATVVEYSIECDNGMFFAKFLQNKHGAVLLHIVRFRIAILPQELDGHHWTGVDGLGCVFAASFRQNAEALRCFLHQLLVA